MRRQPLILAVALSLAIVLTVIAAMNFTYLGDGYSLDVSLSGAQKSVYHVDFPLWRRVANIGLWLAACVGVWLFYIGHRHALFSAVASLAATLVVGAADIYSYGSIGSPRAFWTIIALVTLTVAVLFRSRLLAKNT